MATRKDLLFLFGITVFFLPFFLFNGVFDAEVKPVIDSVKTSNTSNPLISFKSLTCRCIDCVLFETLDYQLINLLFPRGLF